MVPSIASHPQSRTFCIYREKKKPASQTCERRKKRDIYAVSQNRTKAPRVPTHRRMDERGEVRCWPGRRDATSAQCVLHKTHKKKTHLQNLEVLDRDPVVPHPAGHLLALEHTAGVLALTGRPDVPFALSFVRFIPCIRSIKHNRQAS